MKLDKQLKGRGYWTALNLLIEVNALQAKLEHLIMATPSSSARNYLAEANGHLMSAAGRLKKVT